jgi:hypothetical protein
VADNRYVVIDYVAEGYNEVQNTAWYIESDYFELGYVIQGTTQSGEAAVSAASTITATADRFRDGTLTATTTATFTTTTLRIKSALATLSSDFTLSASSAVVRSGLTNLQSAFSLTIDADDINGAVLSAFTNVSLSALPRVDFSAQADITTSIAVSALALRIKPADISMSAFNTVVTVGGRIRMNPADCIATTAMTATGLKIFDATATPVNRPTGVHLSNNDYFSVAPSSSYGVGTGFIVSVWARFGNLQNISSTILSHMTASDTSTAQSLQIGFNKNNNFGFSVYNFGGFSGPGPRGQTVGGGGAIDFTPQPGWHHFLFRVTQWNAGVQGNPYTTINNTEFWIDGVKVGDSGGAGPNGGLSAYFANPSYVGAAQIAARFENNNQTIYTNTLIAGASIPTAGPGIYAVNEQDIDIRQLWIGEANTTQFNINKFYSNGYVDMGASGVSSGLPTPQIYNIFDLPAYQAGIFTPRTYGNLTVNSLATGNTLVANAFYPPGVTQTINSGDYYPYDYVPGGHIPMDLPMVATFTAIGDNVVGFDASLTSEFTISSEFGYIFPNSANISIVSSLTGTMTDVFPSTANLSSQFAFTATNYEFTKATVAMSSSFAFSADTDEISSGVVLSPMAFTLSANLSVNRPSAANNFLSEFTLTADSTTNSLGIVIMNSVFAVEAIPRVTLPIRPESMTMSAAFSLAADSRRYRDSPVPMASAFTVTNGITRAVRNVNISMTAFNAVLSAGKIVEFLAEHIITVTEEQRLLRVALESTVLLVQMANGVNSVMAETTDIVVAQEQGVLLAQYNTPTN